MAIQTLGLSPPKEKRGNPLENPSVPLAAGADWMWFNGGRDTDAAEVINDRTALQISTVFSCIRILSEAVASLPLRLLRVTPSGREWEVANPLHSLFSIAPNPEMTAFTYFETVTAHLNLTGNSYSQIQRSGDGRAIALWPLSPRDTHPVRLPDNSLGYETKDGGVRRILKAADVLHVPLTSWDGILGMSPITMAARALGLASAAEKYGSRVFANGTVPMIALTTQKLVKPEDKVKMRQQWEELQSGSNQHRVAVLDQGSSIEKLGITPEESQFLETRKYQRAEIGSLFRIPAHMLGDIQKLSNSNVEQMNLQFITDTLRPIVSRIEAEISKKLLLPLGSDLVAQFDLSERQRGDWASLTAGIASGRQWGTLTTNEARRMLNLDPIAGPLGNVLLAPANMMNAERLLDAPANNQEVSNEQ